MNLDQLTLDEQSKMFGVLVENKNYCKEEKGVAGANVFRKKIGGFLGRKIRSEDEMLQTLINMNLVGDQDKAKEFLRSLDGKTVTYGGMIRHVGGGFYEQPRLAKYFRLEKVGSDIKPNYRIHLWDTVPTAD